MKNTLTAKRTAWYAAMALAPTGAAAHHVADGAMPTTIVEGLLSGLAHPVIEPGHLLFLMGAAALAAFVGLSRRRAAGLGAVLVMASLFGTLIAATRPVAPAVDSAVAGTLAVLALAMWTRRLPATVWTCLAAGGAGLVHGLAYGEAVVGAEQTPVLAYLLGLAVVQGLLMAGVHTLLARPRAERVFAHVTWTRLCACVLGAVAVGVWAA